MLCTNGIHMFRAELPGYTASVKGDIDGGNGSLIKGSAFAVMVQSPSRPSSRALLPTVCAGRHSDRA